MTDINGIAGPNNQPCEEESTRSYCGMATTPFTTASPRSCCKAQKKGREDEEGLDMWMDMTKDWTRLFADDLLDSTTGSIGEGW